MGAGSWQRMSRALVIALWVAVTAAPMASRADETYILCGPKSVGFIRTKGQTACLGGSLDWRQREHQRQAAEAPRRDGEAQTRAPVNVGSNLNSHVSDNLNAADQLFQSGNDGCNNVAIAIMAANSPAIYGPTSKEQRAELKEYAKRCNLRYN